MKIHVVRSGDTLGRIALKEYGDAGKAKMLADYNGITNLNLIKVGWILHMPKVSELTAPAVSEEIEPIGPKVPHGHEEIVKTFGNIYSAIKPDMTLSPAFASKHFGRVKLPFAIPLSWAPDKKVLNMYCHKKLKDVFFAVFDEIRRKRLKKHVQTFGGCYNLRYKRKGNRLSTHSWGIAIDLNVATNQMGSPGDMNEKVVEIFEKYGFKWGGDWKGAYHDPMHFQYCTGY